MILPNFTESYNEAQGAKVTNTKLLYQPISYKSEIMRVHDTVGVEM